jgi:predicted nuclease with TOPRIM domain
MENHKNSTGFQQFGHLEDKIKRTTMLVNELEDELSIVRKTYSDLSDQRKTLLRDNTILEHKCSLLEDANKLSHAKATEIADRVEYFLELFG